VNISSIHHTRPPFKAVVLGVVHACRATFFISAVCAMHAVKMSGLWCTDLNSSVDLPGQQHPTSIRHLGRLAPVVHLSVEPPTSDVCPAVARPAAALHRQHPLQPTPPRQNTLLDTTSPHQTAPTSTIASSPQRRSQNSAPHLLVGSATKCCEGEHRWRQPTHI
ncbi:unnamed protein product, partial [Schistosoma margrebowiei]